MDFYKHLVSDQGGGWVQGKKQSEEQWRIQGEKFDEKNKQI